MSFNILIVDDSPLARKIVARALRMCGVPLGELLEASNGKEALAQLESHWVDLVLADVNMPQMDGSALVEHMARNEMLASIPVIVISSDRTEARMDDLLQIGARAYLTKPLVPEEVRGAVQSILLGGGGP